jgi:hypothetical protein
MSMTKLDLILLLQRRHDIRDDAELNVSLNSEDILTVTEAHPDAHPDPDTNKFVLDFTTE